MDVRVRVAALAILANLAILAVKIVLAKATGSASIRADAVHSLSDVLVSILVLIGVRIGSRKRENGMVNWAGVEHVVAIVVGVFILYAAFGIFREAVSAPGRSLLHVPLALVGLFACVLGSFTISRMEIGIGETHQSPALVADGLHARMNMYSTIGVMVSLVGFMIGLNLDSAAAAVIALLIAVTGIEIVTGAARGLRRGRPIEDFFAVRLLQKVVLRMQGRGLRHGEGMPVPVGPPRRAILGVGAAILLVAWLTTAFSAVAPGQRLLVLRFGRIVRHDLGPGIHTHLPWPVDRPHFVDVGRIRRVEIGFRTSTEPLSFSDRSYQWESRHSSGGYAKKLEESVMLTGDINLVDMNSVVQYRVSDAVRFFMAAEDPDQLVRVASEAALRSVIGREQIDDLLTTDRRIVEGICRDLIQSFLDPYDAGLEVTGVRLQDVHPPLEVVASFRDVASAREDRSRLVNEAHAYRNSVLPKARGEAETNRVGAEATAAEKVTRASGEAGRFLSLLEEYRKAPGVTKTRLYLETLEAVLPGMEKLVIEPQPGEEPVDLRFYRGAPGVQIGGP